MIPEKSTSINLLLTSYYSGKFVVRVDPGLHRRISTQAQMRDKSLNQWVQETLEEAVP